MPNAAKHLFRHSIRDRLRNVNVQSEMNDQLVGWSIKTVRQEYYDLFALYILYSQTLELKN